VGRYTDARQNLRVYSLYGDTRKPRREWLEDIDAVVFDLQDVGSRWYTFIWTLDLVMEACAENKKGVVVLDRPNPIGGTMMEAPSLA